MAAPTVDDVELFTAGRLSADAESTAASLAAVVAAARRYCGWHVTGEQTDTMTVDGDGGRLLLLPTLRLLDVASIVEDGVDVALDSVTWSTRGVVTKNDYARWTRRSRGVTVTITHGFDDAPDWNRAVLSAIDRTSMGAAVRLVVGPFQYQAETTAAGSMFSITEKAVLDLYKLEPGTCPAQIVSGS